MHGFEGDKPKNLPRDVTEVNECCVIDVEGTDLTHQGFHVNE